jgi:ABC-type transport system involved in multi-copper enzyme maturation permease subunit
MPIVFQQLAKEYGALLPAFIAVVAAFLASTLGIPYLRELAAPAYVVAAMSIGALSFGHEYTSRTLPLLLVQPCRRERLLLLKLIAAASLLLPVAWLLHASQLLVSPVVRTYVDAAVILAIALAPCLTMATRNAIAGAVFTFATPGLLLVAGDIIASARFGPAAEHALQHDAFRMPFLRAGTLITAAVGLVLTWRTFMRLEALDDPGPVYASSWLRGARDDTATPTLQPRAWLLLKKELHLQQLTMTVAALYLVARLIIARFVTPVDALFVTPNDVNSIFVVSYTVIIAALAGATASAEERHLGTLEWQLLLPSPAWQQWAVKVGVALGLAIVLGIVVPWIIWPRQMHPPFIAGFEGARLVVAITVGSLYLSTISSSGLWALLASVPAAVGTMAFLRVVADPVGVAAFELAGGVGDPARAYVMWWTGDRHAELILALLLAIVLLVPLWCGLVNHRTANRARSRVVLQTSAIAVAVVLVFVVLGVVSARF